MLPSPPLVYGTETASTGPAHTRAHTDTEIDCVCDAYTCSPFPFNASPTCISHLQAAMQNVFHFCLIVFPMVFSLCLFNVITDSMLTNSVPSSDTGEFSCGSGTSRRISCICLNSIMLLLAHL